MKRILIILFLAVAGIGLFAYPVVSDYLFTIHASTAVQRYDQLVDQGTADEIKQALQQATDYNDQLKGELHDPFLKGSGMVMSADYINVLNLSGDGTMGYITIPKINVKLPIYHGTAESILQNGIGHLEGSSLPIGGKGTHSVLTGHTGLVHAKLFTDLNKLTIGDTFYLHILDQVLAYQVDQIKVVLPDDVSNLLIDKDEDYCTLVTCTPYGINNHRLQVRGRRIDYVPETEQALMAQSRQPFQWFKEWYTLIGLAIGFFVIIVVGIVVLKRIKKKPELEEYTCKRNNRKKQMKKYWWDMEDQ